MPRGGSETTAQKAAWSGLRPPKRWEPVVTALLGGTLLGAAQRGPHFGILAWPGTVLVVLAIARSDDRRRALGAFLAASMVQHVLWFWWAFPLARAMAPGGTFNQLFVGAGFILVVGLPVTALVALGILLLHERPRVPVFAWLPLAWAMGEQLAVRWTSIVDDWISTQVDVPWVMRSVHWLGAVPTLLLCLAAAAALGQWLATRRHLGLTKADVRRAAGLLLLQAPAG